MEFDGGRVMASTSSALPATCRMIIATTLAPALFFLFVRPTLRVPVCGFSTAHAGAALCEALPR